MSLNINNYMYWNQSCFIHQIDSDVTNESYVYYLISLNACHVSSNTWTGIDVHGKKLLLTFLSDKVNYSRYSTQARLGRHN